MKDSFLISAIALVILTVSCDRATEQGTLEGSPPNIQQGLKKDHPLDHFATSNLMTTDSTVIAEDNGKVLSYAIFDQNESSQQARILMPDLGHDAPVLVKESILKSIAAKHSFKEVGLYSSMTAYYEIIKNDAPDTKFEWNQKYWTIWKGYIGSLSEGKYTEYELVEVY